LLGDVELIVMAKRVLISALGSERFSREIVLQINTLGDVESRQAFGVVLREFLERRRSQLSPEGFC
jgi:hypothetical protein